VGRLRDFAIPFTGLKDGKHEFDFKIDDTFFVHFAETEIHKGLLRATVQMEKGINFLELQINISGIVEVICDRCLESFNLPVDCSNNLYVRFGERSYEQSEEVVILATGESEINMAQYFYEYIHLALPYSKVHSLIPGGTCNKGMLNRLNAAMPNRNNTGGTDPRWEQLKKLI
jgi:uncharacterized metal-binding protein YceD (DUF177 family)